MISIASQYNRVLLVITALAPFLGWATVTFFDMDILRIVQLLSFIGVILIIALKKKDASLKFPGYLFFYLLFILYDFFSTIYILKRDFEFMWLFSNRMIGAFNLLFIIENLIITKNLFRKILIISKITVVVAVFVIVVQQISDPSFFVRMNELLKEQILEESVNSNRLVSIYSWMGGLIMVGFGFIPLFLFVTEDAYRKGKSIVIWILIGMIYALLSKARWIMLNGVLVFLIFFLNKNWNVLKILKFAVGIPALIVLFYFSLNLIGVNAKGIVEERILESNKSSLEQKSMSTRILAVEAFNKFFWDHPIWGRGNIKYGMGGTGQQDYKLRSFLGNRSSQIHVGYLSLFYLYGIIGGVFFMIFLIKLLRQMYTESKETTYWSPFLGVLGFALANVTLVTFTFFEVGLIVMMMVHKYYLQNYKIEEIDAGESLEPHIQRS